MPLLVLLRLAAPGMIFINVRVGSSPRSRATGLLICTTSSHRRRVPLEETRFSGLYPTNRRHSAPPRESRFSSLYRNKLVVQSGHKRQSKPKQPFLQDRETVKGRRTFLHCSTLTTLTTYTFARAHTKTPFCQPFANNTARKMRPLLAAVAAEARVMSSCLIVGCLHYPQAAQAPGVPRGWGELAESGRSYHEGRGREVRCALDRGSEAAHASFRAPSCPVICSSRLESAAGFETRPVDTRAAPTSPRRTPTPHTHPAASYTRGRGSQDRAPRVQEEQPPWVQ